MIAKTAACLTVLLAAATAHADGAEGDKSEDLATSLSVVGSVAGPVLIMETFNCCDGYQNPNQNLIKPMVAAGVGLMVLGPSAGDWYAGKTLTRGLGWRIAGGIALAAGGGLVISNLFSDANAGSVLVGGGLFLGGAGAVIAGTAMDVWDAHTAVRDYNASRRHASLVPTGRGVALVGTF